jgi:hypothetical protein
MKKENRLMFNIELKEILSYSNDLLYSFLLIKADLLHSEKLTVLINIFLDQKRNLNYFVPKFIIKRG